MSAVEDGEGAPAGGRPSAGAVAVSDSDVGRIGSFAARVLEDLYAVVYGERPVGVRVWCDGSALLMVLRLAGPADVEQPQPSRMLPCEAIPELVTTAVRAQTGWALAIGSWSVEAELGLAMFVFCLPPVRPPDARTGRMGAPGGGGGDAGREARRSALLSSMRVPAWPTWAPLAGDAVLPAVQPQVERRRLRLVED